MLPQAAESRELLAALTFIHELALACLRCIGRVAATCGSRRMIFAVEALGLQRIEDVVKLVLEVRSGDLFTPNFLAESERCEAVDKIKTKKVLDDDAMEEVEREVSFNTRVSASVHRVKNHLQFEGHRTKIEGNGQKVSNEFSSLQAEDYTGIFR